MDVGANKLAVGLEAAESILNSSRLDWHSRSARVATLRERLTTERLQLAILGQFKRGKSTFINALLGAPVLPVAVVPLTAVAIFIAWGAKPVARVWLKERSAPEEFCSDNPQSLADFLAGFVAEDRNPKNGLGVDRVELQYPAPLLANGIVLIDTPGVGSSHRHNTETAIRVLPECDAAFFVISADPPITETELAYLQQIKSRVSRIFFVLNKMDYLGPDERQTVVAFVRNVLEEHALLDTSDPIFCVSARDALAAKQSDDKSTMVQSGLAHVEEFLLHDLARKKAGLLEQAVRRKADDILAEAIGEAELRVRALTLPIDQLTSKADAFENALRTIEDQRRVLRDLIAGDKRRLIELVEGRIATLRKEASTQLDALAKAELSNGPADEAEQRTREAISTALNGIFEAARERLRKELGEETTKAFAQHQDRLGELVDSVRRSASEIFDVPLSSRREATSFELGEDPYWVTERINTTLIPDPGRLIDRLVPLRARRARLHGRIARQTNELIVRNAENLRWALLRGIEETVMRAADQFEIRLDEAISGTRGIIDAALARRKSHSTENESELATLGRLIDDLTAVRGSIAADVL